MGLIAHYRLDGDAKDALGNQDLSFSLAGSWVTGMVGQSFSMVGGGEATVAPSALGLNLNTNRWSISGWIAPNWTSWETNANRHAVFELGEYYMAGETSIALSRHYIDSVTKNIRFSIYEDKVGKPSPSPHTFTIPELDSWIFVAVYCDGVNLHFSSYAIQSDTWKHSAIAVNWNTAAFPIRDNIYIGGYGWDRSCWRGGLDDFRIHDHCLSLREVRDFSLAPTLHFPLRGDTTDHLGPGSMDIGSGSFVSDPQMGEVADVSGTVATVPFAQAPLKLSGETIICWQKCDAVRTDIGGGGFTSRIVQWGEYHTNNSGGFGIISGNLTFYLRGPGASGWTDNSVVSSYNHLYDQGGWIQYAIVFTTDDRFKVYMNDVIVVDIPLSSPYTGLTSAGVEFGNNMLSQLSGVEILSTALTAEQIGERYRQRASIDNEGSVYSSEIYETGYKPIIGPSYEVWTPGTTGSEPGFSRNGSAEKSSRVTDTGPHGESATLWQADNTDTDSTNDGGWNGSNFPIDNTKRYRFSVWIRRKVIGNGSGYWGTHGYGSVNGVLSMGGANTTNPYFWSGGIGNTDWFLVVGHIHPVGYTGGEHADTGRYYQDGSSAGGASDFVWRPETTEAHHRAYLFYSTDLTTQQQMAYPRVDVCDGTEPTIQQLVDGFDIRWSQNGFPKELSVRGQLMLPRSSEVGVTRGLVAWYPLIGDTLDYAGTNHAVNNGAVATSEGYRIDGSAEINIPNNSELSTDKFTYSFRMRHNSAVSGSFRQFFVRPSRQPGLWLRNNDQRIHYSVRFRNAVNYTADMGTPTVEGDWHHVTVTLEWDGVQTVMRSYLDGALVGSGVHGERPSESTSGITLKLDTCEYADVRAYNVALTPEEVATQAKLALSNAHRTAFTANCMYTSGQIKEVTA